MYEVVVRHAYGNRQEVQTTVGSLKQANAIVQALAGEKFLVGRKMVERFTLVYARDKEMKKCRL